VNAETISVLILLAWLIPAVAARSQEPPRTGKEPKAGITVGVTSTSSVIVTPFLSDKRQDFEVTIAAKPSEVWKALTTEEGIRSFYAPAAKIEMIPGGAYEIYYKPDAPPGERGMEGTQVLSFVPNEMLAGTGSAPPQFPTVQKEKTKWVILLDDLGNGQTRFRMSLLEFGTGPEWDHAYEYFLKNNAAFPEMLRKRFVDGPVDWAARGVTLPPPTRNEPVSPAAVKRLWRVDKSARFPAQVSDVWSLLTTRRGLEKWAGAYANVQLKFGGAYELYYNPSVAPGQRGLEGTKVLAYVPNEMLSYSWLARPEHPEVRKGPTWVVWRIVDEGKGMVRVRYTVLGLGEGPEWEAAFNDLDKRMELELRMLQGAAK